jgi:uncharacterized protein (DUF1330 family)
MAKGYIVARMTVHDADAYMNYAKGARVAMEKYGARILALAGQTASLQGEARERNVILEFSSFEQAQAYYNSPEYQEARLHRIADGVSEGEIVAIEGFEGPQPGEAH